MKHLFYILLLALPISGFSSSNHLDSLNKVWNNLEIEDTIRIKAFNKLIYGLIDAHPDSGRAMAYELMGFSKKIKNKYHEIYAIQLIGTSYKAQGNYDSAAVYYSHGYEESKKTKNKKLIARALNMMAMINDLKSDYGAALNKWGQCLKLYKSLNDSNGISNTLSNMATIEVSHNGNLPKAIGYLTKSINIKKKIGDKRGLAISLYSLGKIQYLNKNYDLALDIYEESSVICDEIGQEGLKIAILNERGLVQSQKKDTVAALTTHQMQYDIAKNINYKLMMGIALGNIGTLQSKTEDALIYVNRALELYQEIGWKDGIVGAHNNLGRYHLKLKEIDKAIHFGSEGLALAEKIGHIKRQEELHSLLSKAYEADKNHTTALIHYKKYIVFRDSINNEENQKAVIRQQTQYEFEKAQIIKENEAKEQVRLEAEAKGRRNNLQYSLIFLGILLLFGIVLSLGYIKVSANIAEGLIFFAFLILFEFILVFTEPYIEQYTNDEPMYNLLANSVLALVIFPLHAILERLLKKRIVK